MTDRAHVAATPDKAFSMRDLSDAVAAGIIDAAAAERLGAFLGQRSANDAGSEDEQLRLVSGFGDIFVAIGLVLFLGALSFIAGGSSPLAALAVAVAAWGLAELFTRIRRQALPSILLLVAFAGAVFSGVYMFLEALPAVEEPAAMLGAGLATCAAAALHWWRFQVPITIAAACAAVTATLLGALSFALPNILTAFSGLIFLPIGLAVFSLAMRFDTSDRERRTRRTDIAFWLHALAAPMVVHPVMQNVMYGGSPGAVAALLTFVLFALLSLVALTVDRRAMLVSSLLYLGYAIFEMLKAGDALPSTSVAVLLVGAVVLGMSFAWRPLRAALLSILPATIAQRVPPPHLTSSKTG